MRFSFSDTELFHQKKNRGCDLGPADVSSERESMPIDLRGPASNCKEWFENFDWKKVLIMS